MICQCGATIREGAKFCGQCGRPVTLAQPDFSAVPAQQAPSFAAPPVQGAGTWQPVEAPSAPVQTPDEQPMPWQRAASRAPVSLAKEEAPQPVQAEAETADAWQTPAYDETPSAPPFHAPGSAPVYRETPQPVPFHAPGSAPAEAQPAAPDGGEPAEAPQPSFYQMFQGVGRNRGASKPSADSAQPAETSLPETEVASPAKKPGNFREILQWALIGVGAVLLILGIVSLIMGGGSASGGDFAKKVTEIAAENPESDTSIPKGSFTTMVDSLTSFGGKVIGAAVDPVLNVADVPTKGGASEAADTVGVTSGGSSGLLPSGLVWPSVGVGAAALIGGVALLIFKPKKNAVPEEIPAEAQV